MSIARFLKFHCRQTSVLLLIALTLAGCEGPTVATTQDDSDNQATPATTFARSFGNAYVDAAMDLESDAGGNLWLLGTFAEPPVTGLLPEFAQRSWLARLDETGFPALEMSPQSAAGKHSVRWKFGEATPDGGALFAGDVESREGKNILLQFQDAAGDIVWERQLDGTAYWQRQGMTFDPARPGSDEALQAVHGRSDYGWWIIADSQAFGFDASRAASYGAPNVLVWFIDPNGVVSDGSPLNYGAVLVNRSADEESAKDALATYHAASISIPSGPVRLADSGLMLMVRVTSAASNVNQLRLFRLRRRDDGSILPDGAPSAVSMNLDEKYLPSPTLTRFTPTVGGAFSNSDDFISLELPKRKGTFSPYRLRRFDYVTEHWEISIPNLIDVDINAIATTRWSSQNATAGTVTDHSSIWLGGQVYRDQRWSPAIWKIDKFGIVGAECVLDAGVSTYRGENVVAMFRAGQGEQLRLLVRTGASSDQQGLVEIRVRDNCDVVSNSWQVYPAATPELDFAFTLLNGRPKFIDRVDPASPAGPALETLTVRSYRRIVQFDQASGDQLATIPAPRAADQPTDPVAIAVSKTADQRAGPDLVVTGNDGRIQAFDDAGQSLYHLAIEASDGFPLLDPTIDRDGSVWTISGGRLFSVDSSLNAMRTRFGTCFWSPARVAAGLPCIPPDILAIDGGSIAINRLHILGRGPQSDQPSAVGDRYFRLTLDTERPETAEVRYLPDEINNALSAFGANNGGDLVLRSDSIDGGADDPMLVQVAERPTALYVGDNNAGRTVFTRSVYHYGRSDATRWRLNSQKLALRDARLAHDGGVVLLLVASGSQHELSELLAESALDKNIALLKLTAAGATQWLRIYGTRADDLPVSLERTTNGYAIAAVSRGVDAVTPGSADVFVLKTGIDGHIAADASGTEFCQAGIVDLSGAEVLTRLQSVVDDALVTRVAALSGDTVVLRNNSLSVNSLPGERSNLMSNNSARQCLGAATNVQENPFTSTQDATVSVTVAGSGIVNMQSGTGVNLDCAEDCTVQVAIGAPVTLTATAANDWRFDSWSGDPACQSGAVSAETQISATASAISCIATFVENQQPPVAAFSVSPLGPLTTNDVVVFDAAASTGSVGSVLTYAWDFGDNGVVDATSATASRSYAIAGTYAVRLTVTDDQGLSDSIVATLIIVDALSEAPSAAFSIAPAGPITLGTALTLNGSGSTDDVGVVSWQWDVGDDGTIDATGEVVSLTPTVAGPIPIRLTVQDADGQLGEVIQTVQINPPGTATLTLTILGGPGAGQVRSTDALIPTMDCINSATPETTCTADFASGTLVELIPEPFGTGEAGVQWTGCDSDNGIEGCSLTMDVDRAVTATFVAPSAGNNPPQVLLIISPNAGVTTQTVVNFDASGSIDLDGTIDPVSGYQWDFDSDGTVDATGARAAHMYPSPGDYIVTLEVFDDDGASSVETNRVVRVAAAP